MRIYSLYATASRVRVCSGSRDRIPSTTRSKLMRKLGGRLHTSLGVVLGRAGALFQVAELVQLSPPRSCT